MSQPQSKFKPQPAGEIAGNKWIKKSITLLLPIEWWDKIDQYMKEHGYTTFPELLRDLIREKVIEGGK